MSDDINVSGCGGLDAEVIRLWIARLCAVSPPVRAALKEEDDEDGKTLRRALGIRAGSSEAAHHDRIKKILSKTPQMHSGNVTRNVAAMADFIGLTKLEQEILSFAVLLSVDGVLECVSNRLGPCSQLRTYELLAAVCGSTTNEIREKFSERATLVESGIITLEPNYFPLQHKLAIHEAVLDALVQEYEQPTDIIRRFVDVPPQTDLALADFPHLAAEGEFLVAFLEEVRKGRANGVNILLYGETGTGKTEFAKALVRAAGGKLYGVPCTTNRGSGDGRSARIASYAMCQRFLRRDAQAVLLFDEMEDVFPADEMLISSGWRLGKAWMNVQLETNAVPTIWVANEIEQIDAAFLRRFDYSIKFTVPPCNVRREMLRKSLSGVPAASELCDRLARVPGLSPALVGRAVRMARLTRATGAELADIVEDAVRRSQALLSGVDSAVRRQTTECDLEAISADANLNELAQLCRGPHFPGPILLYGVPGSGKTSVSAMLARAAGLLPKGVKAELCSGAFQDADELIRTIFETAKLESAAPVLDDAECVLGDRLRLPINVQLFDALLTRLECFDGLFIACTRRIEWMDESALRRFPVKVKFGYLDRAQRRRLFRQAAGNSNDSETDPLLQKVESFSNLVVGDFAVIRSAMISIGRRLSPEECLDLLRKESELKSSRPTAPIGFTASAPV